MDSTCQRSDKLSKDPPPPPLPTKSPVCSSALYLYAQYVFNKWFKPRFMSLLHCFYWIWLVLVSNCKLGSRQKTVLWHTNVLSSSTTWASTCTRQWLVGRWACVCMSSTRAFVSHMLMEKSWMKHGFLKKTLITLNCDLIYCQFSIRQRHPDSFRNIT